MLISLFVTFFFIGLVSFGGGYAMIPLIQEEVIHRHQWMDASQLTDIVGVAGMSPGPIATNIAIFVGYREAGVIGAIVTTLAMVLPSLIIILTVGAIFFKLSDHKLVRSFFYGVRPVVTGLIIYAAIVFAQNSGQSPLLSWFTLSQFLIFAGSFCALMFYRKHPLAIILVSGLVGIALYA